MPQRSEDGRDKQDIIEGRVIGSHPGQRIVVYARSGTWWVQPLVSEPFTSIRRDSRWTNATHLGTEYAALLVEPGFRPSPRTDVLPARGGPVAAVAIVTGQEFPPSPVIQFSGYEWRARDAPSTRGGWHAYDPRNAWTDASGALHLRVKKISGKWTCAEVTLTRSFGYGTYSFVVRDTSRLESAVAFSMFTWDYAGSGHNNREMDIEISRWGDPASDNAQFVVQPFHIPSNVVRFTTPSGVLTHSFRWQAGSVSFRTVRGSKYGDKAHAVAEHTFASGVPSPGIESVRLNLYALDVAKVPLQNGAEVVVEKFQYLP
ncbi:MAG: hypothetical protein JO091_12090 [Acidobacteriaceae bacterium]|nr:hypothetical protein [Acidobacteriaceae bacterium]